ncbi:MAG: ThuA domain-containing protein [Planctomycetales bacterium]|nr:ThuA domain-containing protein [Planctomycetales bacterium]
MASESRDQLEWIVSSRIKPTLSSLNIMKIPLSILVAFVALVGTPGLRAAEPPGDGLLFWLDAQELGRELVSGAASTPPKPIVSWPDRSPSGRDFNQTVVEHQPQLVKIEDDFVVRFDGESDRLRCTSHPTTTQSLTLLFVAAALDNPGDFRGFFGANSPGTLDYVTGFNVDLGPPASSQVDYINVEGKGFGGARNLCDDRFGFGQLRIFAVTVDAATGKAKLRVDGRDAGEREYVPGHLSLEELTLGARFLFHDANREQIRCALKCDIAEVLLYDHALGEKQITEIESYLGTKYERLEKTLPEAIRASMVGIPLTKADAPPPIQMLIDGFHVTEIPVELTNVNSVRFRRDGKLVTLGYNGDIHLLSDTDGDGIEDEANLFWKNEGSLRGPIGMVLTPDGFPQGNGVITPSKGKVSLIVDQDGDDRADQEIVIASGWNEIPQNVDATGMAMAADGSLYFGLGTADYSNAFLIDDDGVSHYRLDSDRGTVQRLSPDFKTRETVCTGIRFPIAFAFNPQGDLFCTEQEGATWLANGNPFDELLHIQTGRHYGFPPRHPKHNPDVLDEPSTFNYGPQHQSTCGMIFNQGVNGGPVFGPDHWAGDAIVCGESRGKLWRTSLVNSQFGYVARTQLIACLQMLTVDACVAPDGDLVVACHTGPPDWGTGPTGIGKLFRIKTTNKDAARPVATWAAGQREINIAFDQPLDPLQLKGIVENARVEYGSYVSAGDRFENLVPPYAVVRRQSRAPRFELAVHGVSITNDLRTLVIATDPMTANVHYAVTLPSLEKSEGTATKTAPRHPQIDVDFTLGGVNAAWKSAESNESWSGWLPHLDWQVSDQMTQHSASHDDLRSKMAASNQHGSLTLNTLLDLSDVLRPKVQPGSRLDAELPEETVTLVVRASVPFVMHNGNVAIANDATKQGHFESTVTVTGEAALRVPITIQMTPTGGKPIDLTAAIRTAEDDRLRPLPLNRFYLPWVRDSNEPDPAAAQLQIAELEGGNWGHGRRVFHSAAAACFQCHAINGVGQTIGPDLGHLRQRDYESVLRDIQHPSYAINPDYIGHNILTKEGTVLTGVMRSDNGRLLIGDANGKVTAIMPSEIESSQPAKASIMPTGLLDKLAPDQVRDLMTFLLTPPPQMPLAGKLQAPPTRTPTEVADVLAGSVEPTTPARPLEIVLVAGNKDHGPGEHDYPAWQVQWYQLLSAAENVHVDTAWDFPSNEQLGRADVLIFFQKGAWNDHRQKAMDDYFGRGKGAVYIHWAVNGDERVGDFSKRIGLASRGGSIAYRHGPLNLEVHNTDHPIMRNLGPLSLYDESYWLLTGDPMNVTLLASSVEQGAAQPQVWIYEKDAGRVFVSIPGHYSWTFDDPIFRTLLLRGIAWTAKEPVDRFNELVPLGARISSRQP